MKKAYKILPVYTGDVSGFASALYELGGMLVIHDPSGCNSTYNTHDEVRWYKQEALIYISGLNDIDAITGNDGKFTADIVRAAEEMKPKFIALANSPLPYLNGTDFKGISKIVEDRTGLPCFYVQTNAMHDYTKGASEAFLAFAKKMLKPADRKIEGGINILGSTPLDHVNTGFVIPEGKTLVSNWAYKTSLEDVMKATQAELNIVVSSTGLAAAEYMKKEFGMPYGLMGSYLDVKREESHNYIVGEPVISGYVASQIKKKYGTDLNVIATTEITDGLLADCDRKCHGEDEIRQALSDADMIIGDPLFELIAPKNAKFVRLPHFAMSGRLYRKEIPDLMRLEDYYNEP
ncbi:MAG: nitrogenase component 1 [Saccharofermentans sp.]|nr:nitrogenase component 1 [Saccharofermentans sp.]